MDKEIIDSLWQAIRLALYQDLLVIGIVVAIGGVLNEARNRL